MKNNENDTAQEGKRSDLDPVIDPVIQDPGNAREVGSKPAGLFDRMRGIFSGTRRGAPPSARELSQDRTRSLVLLIGGSVGAVLLFIGVFSTPPRPSLQETRSQADPNLGRPAAAAVQSLGPQGSVTPLLTADVRSTDLTRDQLSPSDISGTSRRSIDPEQSISPSNTTARRTPSYRSRVPPERPPDRSTASTSGADDPLAQYRIDDETGVPTYRYGLPQSSDSARSTGTSSYGNSGTLQQSGPRNSAGASRSSMVFVRDGKAPAASMPTIQVPTVLSQFDSGTPLPPGTRLVARVDAVATSALRTPVVASIEYNYERDGAIAVAAGSKVIGEIRQASADGYVDVRFHTLQTTDGRDVSIEATATGLDLKPLKGTVSGKNTGRRILSRTLSGVGTVAAYVVGGGGGLSSAVTGETLLRDRIAGNIALAGEEQLRSAAYTQNISIALPANTRFYVVLQKAATSPDPPSSGSEVPEIRRQPEVPSVQELRELMDLRREINRMYQESSGGLGGVSQ